MKVIVLIEKLGRVFIVSYLFATTRIFGLIWFRFRFRFYLTHGSNGLIHFAIIWIHCMYYDNNEYLGYRTMFNSNGHSLGYITKANTSEVRNM
jgi:hypothetical protein